MPKVNEKAELVQHHSTTAERDVWADADNKLIATEVTNPSSIVHDDDAPYGFCKHVWRVQANTNREAIKLYRQELKKIGG